MSMSPTWTPAIGNARARSSRNEAVSDGRGIVSNMSRSGSKAQEMRTETGQPETL